MAYNDPSDLRFAKEIAWAQQHGAFNDGQGRALLRSWQLGIIDEKYREMLESRIKRLRMSEVFGRLNPFSSPQLRSGELRPGKDMDGTPIRLPLQDLTGNVLFAGNTGATKTTLLTVMALQLLLLGVNLMLADMHKSQLRHLMPYARKLGRPFVVLRPRRTRLNLLQAGKQDPLAWLSVAVDLLVRVLALPPRARTILNQVCHSLYQEFGIFDGRQDAWPNLYDVFERIKRSTTLNASAREAILDRMAALLLSLGPDSAAYRLAWDPIDLAKFSVVFEMRGASETVKQVQLVPTLFANFTHRVQSDVPNRRLDLFIAFEDAQRFFDSTAQIGHGISPLKELLGVSRSTGLCTCVLVQSMEGVSRRLSANLATKFFGRLGDAQDYQRLGADLSLTRDQLQWAKRNLKPGLFVGQAATGSWREPFLLNVPRLDLEPVVTDQDVDRSERVLQGLPTVPADEYQDWQPYHSVEVSEDLDGTAEAPLSELELRFLRAVVEQPGRSSSEYAKLTSINGSKAAKIRKRLIDDGYLRATRVARKAQGKAAIILEPLEPGIAACAHPTGDAS